MAATKKKKTKVKPAKGGEAKYRKPPTAASSSENNPIETNKSWLSSSSSSSRFVTAVALGGAALAMGYTHFLQQTTDGAGVKNVDGPLSTQELLSKVRRSRSFELTTNNDNNGTSSRTLSATSDIPSNTVLMEIPRELMVWDLDAARDEFVQKELFHASLFDNNNNGRGSTPTKTKSDVMSKRAALLSAYLALLRNDIVTPSKTFPRQLSVAKALPSYDDFASYHPVLADMKQMKKHLGKKSISYLHLVHVRESLIREYDMLGTTFATYVSREDYLACRLAVQSRSFQVSNVPSSEIPVEERTKYKQKLGIDFGTAVVSIEPVNDWMNSHINNNVKVGGYDAKKRSGKAWSTKPIRKGQELINNYGTFYDHVLFSQYGFIPTDGTGTSIASLFVHHDLDLMGELIGETNPSLPPLEKMASYLRYDYGYNECITKDGNPGAFELKRLKLEYLQKIAIDPSRWVLPLPPRSSTDVTPFSTTTIIAPEDDNNYKIPSFGPDIYEYLETNALSASLPCRLIALADTDLDNAQELLKQDLQTLDGSSSTPQQTPVLQLEEIQVSISWFARTVQCMATLTAVQKAKSLTSAQEQERFILKLVEEAGNGVNTLDWNAAHVKLEEIQSQSVLEDWALDVLDKVKDIEGVSSRDIYVRDGPCPEEYTADLI